ncbi:phage portal protein [Hespellia stercorisuis]|uniref:Phage portal protein, SPP1 family n=1 Tax=Hespellia stercorisuis DSM 15480 TaxID=1121950 RepID=A0A1M6RNI9_9FIRM|nr:phage portal protein [Hespellia stercorisuis]SHK34023.1 phage portal protein, SPP1 family [Hespellia stercorisuis DSM 15480]
MQVFTIPTEEFDELNIDKQAIRHLILKHRAGTARLKKLLDYYGGQHKILQDKDRENRLVCNHAKDISDTASSYFIGEPVTYKTKEDITVLTDALENSGADEADGDNGLDLSIYGRAYEYIYTKQSETDLQIKNLKPENTFIVYDDTIEQNELFGVYYYAKVDSRDKTNTVYVATILTMNYKYVVNIEDIEGPQGILEGPEAHFKGEVPVIEYLNNKLAIGDYELQIPLIDAYNALMSDRITDKEQFIDAILAIYGTLLSDEDAEEYGDGKGSEEAMKKLKKEKLLEMPGASNAEYLTRTYDESGVEILKKAIEQDIHKFSHIPCMTDESFGGNVSGVAMEFKLLGMENITKIKTRYYKKGLRKRLRIFSNFLNTRSGVIVDISGITPVFSRAMPKNLLEISQYVANLWGKVSRKTLLSQIPFVDDPEEEMKAVKKEEEETAKRQAQVFGMSGNENTPPPPGEDDVDGKS